MAIAGAELREAMDDDLRSAFARNPDLGTRKGELPGMHRPEKRINRKSEPSEKGGKCGFR